MDKTEKNFMIGALTTGFVDLALEGYFTYQVGLGTPPTDNPLYTSFTPYLPPLDDWLALAGVPLLMYGLGKMQKSKRIVEFAKGGAIYGASELIGKTAYRIVKETQPLAVRYRMVVR